MLAFYHHLSKNNGFLSACYCHQQMNEFNEAFTWQETLRFGDKSNSYLQKSARKGPLTSFICPVASDILIVITNIKNILPKK